PGQLKFFFAEEQLFPARSRETMLSGKADCAFRTGPLAFRAEEAAAKIEPWPFFTECNRVRWTGIGANAAASRAFCGINFRPAAQTVGQNRRRLRETDCAMLL